MTDKTPFDHWWSIYPSTRKKAKARCQEKFNAYDLDTQRHIYLHTKWCLRNHPDWRLEGSDRPYACAPEVYLNQQWWGDWDPAPAATPHATPVAMDDAAQIAALEKLARAAGEDGDKVREQLQQMRDKMGARITGITE